MKKLDPDALEDSLFEVVSLRNCAMSSMDREERKSLAEMNLRAGLKVSNLCLQKRFARTYTYPQV